MRSKSLRNNYAGLVGYTLVLLGTVSGGVWLVLLATSNAVSAAVPGIAAVVLLVCGVALLLYMGIRGRQDPLEPADVDVDTIVDEDSGPGRPPRREGT